MLYLTFRKVESISGNIDEFELWTVGRDYLLIHSIIESFRFIRRAKNVKC